MAKYAKTANHRDMMKLLRKVQTKWHSFRTGETGASLVEYALLVALIALVAIVAIRFFGSELSQSYTDIANSIP